MTASGEIGTACHRPDGLAARISARLLAEPPRGDDGLAGDHDIDPGAPVPRPERARAAAVLVPLVAHSEEITVLLTQRTDNLSTHAGQIAFPGGRIDPQDAGAGAAAIRETVEEIGLDPQAITPLGYLDAYFSSTGYRIIPLVSLVRPGFALRLNPEEVSEAFEVPLAFLMDPANHQRHHRMWKGRMRSFYAMPFGERYIWGVTAGILRNFYERVFC